MSAPNDPASASRDAGLGVSTKLAWLVVFMVPALWFAYLQRHLQGDDAMIVLRYVNNLLAGEGWVFNPGETVQGSTSPLNTLLLLALAKVSGDAVLAQVLAQGLSVGFAAWFAMLLLRDRGLPPAIFGALSILGLPLFGATQGLETAPFACLLLAATWAVSGGCIGCGSFLLGLLYLVRPDGILLVPILFGRLWWEAHRNGELSRVLARSLGPALILVGTWSLWAWLSFGSPLPSTLGAKLAQRESGLWGEGHLFWRGLRHSLDGFFPRGPNPGDAWLISFFLVATVVSMRTRVWPVFVFAVLQSAAYAILNPPYYHWYGLPLHLAMALSVVVVFAVVHPRIRWPAAILPVAWLILSFPDPVIVRQPYTNTLAYRKAAQDLRDLAKPGQTLAAFEVGNLGYHLPQLRILDLCALITPSGQQPLSRGETTWYLAHEPDFILFHEPIWRRLEAPSLEHPEFRGNYELVQGFAPGVGLRLYRRQ